MIDLGTLALIYGVGALASVPVLALFVWALQKAVDKAFAGKIPNSADPRVVWLSAVVGVVERAGYITVLIWAFDAAGAFIGGWIALKAAGGWGTLAGGNAYYRTCYSVGLVGSLLSAMWALAVTGVYGYVNYG